jgi:hypothetical protein
MHTWSQPHAKLDSASLPKVWVLRIKHCPHALAEGGEASGCSECNLTEQARNYSHTGLEMVLNIAWSILPRNESGFIELRKPDGTNVLIVPAETERGTKERFLPKGVSAAAEVPWGFPQCCKHFAVMEHTLGCVC